MPIFPSVVQLCVVFDAVNIIWLTKGIDMHTICWYNGFIYRFMPHSDVFLLSSFVHLSNALFSRSCVHLIEFRESQFERKRCVVNKFPLHVISRCRAFCMKFDLSRPNIAFGRRMFLCSIISKWNFDDSAISVVCLCVCVCAMVRDVQFSKQIKSNFRRSGPRFVFVPFDSNGTIYDICLHAFAYSCPFSLVILSQLSVFIYSAAIYRRVRRTVIYWILQRICYKQISAEFVVNNCDIVSTEMHSVLLAFRLRNQTNDCRQFRAPKQ